MSENPYQTPLRRDAASPGKLRAVLRELGRNTLLGAIAGAVIIGPVLGYRDPANYLVGSAVAGVVCLITSVVLAMTGRPFP